MWTIHTDFCRRRLGHGSRSAKRWLLRRGRRKPLWREAPPALHSARFPVARGGSGGLARAAAGHLGFADESGALFDDEARRLQIALKRATRFQFAALAHGDVALDLAVNGNRFRFDLAADVRVLTDRQHAVGIDFAFDFAVDEQFLLKFDRAFDLDVARKNVFARMFSHIFFWIDCWWWCPWFFALSETVVLLSARA